VISIRGLSASYGERRVLHGVDLDVYRGEIFVLLGGSGSGKTTLLRQVLALAKPDAGTIVMNGTDITSCSASELAAVRRRVGVAFQGSALFNSMTIAENVALAAPGADAACGSIIALMVWMKLKAVGLGNASDFFPHQLSGGMKKRAAIARAMALDPDILVFDEPSAGLDPIVAAGLDELILFLKRAFGMTMLVVTHAMESALHIGDRIRAAARGWAGRRRHPRGIPGDRSSASTPVSRTKGRSCAAGHGRRLRGGVPATDFIMTIEARVGLFVIVSVLVLGATMYSVRTTQDVRGQVIYATHVSYAGGLSEGTPVLFAGIHVGQVISVTGPHPLTLPGSRSRSR
jgi:phospholipid/cholesterol/gamma-HCH transport system ATP-binding protein